MLGEIWPFWALVAIVIFWAAAEVYWWLRRYLRLKHTREMYTKGPLRRLCAP